MAIDESLNERIREVLEGRPRITEKKMFGGMAFLCRNNMFLGARKGRLMVRVGPARYEEALSLEHVQPMEMKGRRFPGYVWVDEAALDDDHELRRFVEWGAGVAGALPAKEAKKKPVASAKKKPAKARSARTR
jgi:TfoX/Sxy family transcriptional regulator of competence genes